MYFLPKFLLFASLCLALVHDAPNTHSNKYLTKELPGFNKISESLRPVMHSGHLELHAENKTNYFFWRFEDKQDHKDKLIFWLNGGPGCSSLDGALMEVGPLRLNEDNEVYFNNGTWMESGTLVFVDQPVGTGFSYGDTFQEELTSVSWDFLVFLKKYFEVFPQDLHKQIYIAGESYAGQYMPYFAKYIDESNEKFGTNYDFQGILIGNGWISPAYTGLSYIEFAKDNGLIDGTESFMTTVYKKHEICQNKVNQLSEDASQQKKNDAYKACDSILNALLAVLHDQDPEGMCVNMYDVRLKDEYPSCGMNWPPDLPYLYSFLGDSDIQRKLNLKSEFIDREVHGHKGTTFWKECNSRVGRALRNEHSKSSEEILPQVLEKYPVVLFNGDKDIICNFIGTEHFINDLEWNNEKGFTKGVELSDWYYNDTNVGLIKSERNLTYVRIFNASHMVPFDVPDISRGIFDLITNNYKRKSSISTGGNGSSINPTLDRNLIVTPVYNVSSNWNHSIIKNRNKFMDDYVQFRYLIYILVIGVIGYGLYYYNSKPTQPQSIMTNNTRKKVNKKKSVQWADEQGPDQRLENEVGYDDFDDKSDDEIPIIDRFDNPRGLELHKNKKKSRIGEMFEKITGKNKVKYQRANGFDVEEEIEMAGDVNYGDMDNFEISDFHDEEDEDGDDGDLGQV